MCIRDSFNKVSHLVDLYVFQNVQVFKILVSNFCERDFSKTEFVFAHQEQQQIDWAFEEIGLDAEIWNEFLPYC